jgi:hypothetical protein
MSCRIIVNETGQFVHPTCKRSPLLLNVKLDKMS